MKKVISLALASVMALSFAACGSTASTASSAASTTDGGAASTAASTASLPKKINVQVPASAGGGTDVVARALTGYINQNSDTNMTVINNTDGSGVVAMETVRTGKPDGSDILLYHTSMSIKTATGVYDYSAAKDFKVIAFGQPEDPGGYVLVVSADSGIATLDDYIAAANDAGGNYMLGIETGGSSHIMGGIMSKALGISLNYVEAGADTDKLTALVGGSINSALVNANQAKQYIEAGKVNALACFSSSEEGGRCSILPDVKSFKEQGYDCVYGTNFYVLANPEMDDANAQAICDLFTAAAKDEATHEILAGAGMAVQFVDYSEGQAKIQASQEQLDTICAELGLVK